MILQKNSAVHSKLIKNIDIEDRDLDIEEVFTNKVGSYRHHGHVTASSSYHGTRSRYHDNKLR